MSEQIMVDDRERLSDGPDDGKNSIVRENLELMMPHNMEKEWRLYEGRGYLDQRYEDKKLLLAKKFDPEYVPCPWPVKREKSGDWSPSNTKRCSHLIPDEGSALERQALAEIHCRAHLSFYFEYYAKIDDNGNPGLPDTTKIYPPKWRGTEGDDPYATKREQVRFAVERKLANQMIKEELADQEIAEGINRTQEELERKRKDRADAVTASAAVDGTEVIKEIDAKEKRGRGRPRKET
jgi:hypothetical protein